MKIDWKYHYNRIWQGVRKRRSASPPQDVIKFAYF